MGSTPHYYPGTNPHWCNVNTALLITFLQLVIVFKIQSYLLQILVFIFQRHWWAIWAYMNMSVQKKMCSYKRCHSDDNKSRLRKCIANVNRAEVLDNVYANQDYDTFLKTNLKSSGPVGTKLVLERRVRANNLLSMKEERVERLTAWGSGARSRAPGGVQGQSPGGGPGGSAPGNSWALAFVKGTENTLQDFSFKSTYICMVQKCFNWMTRLIVLSKF